MLPRISLAGTVACLVSVHPWVAFLSKSTIVPDLRFSLMIHLLPYYKDLSQSYPAKQCFGLTMQQEQHFENHLDHFPDNRKDRANDLLTCTSPSDCEPYSLLSTLPGTKVSSC